MWRGRHQPRLVMQSLREGASEWAARSAPRGSPRRRPGLAGGGQRRARRALLSVPLLLLWLFEGLLRRRCDALRGQLRPHPLLGPSAPLEGWRCRSGWRGLGYLTRRGGTRAVRGTCRRGRGRQSRPSDVHPWRWCRGRRTRGSRPLWRGLGGPGLQPGGSVRWSRSTARSPRGARCHTASLVLAVDGTGPRRRHRRGLTGLSKPLEVERVHPVRDARADAPGRHVAGPVQASPVQRYQPEAAPRLG